MEALVLEKAESVKYIQDTLSNIQPRLEEQRIELPEQYIIECSNDMQYLRQYYFIREYAYRYDLKVSAFFSNEDEVDRYSHLIIARKGHFCVGGSRLTISTFDKRLKLPIERGTFDIQQTLPILKNVSYCELGRTAILPQYRNGDFLKQMFDYSAKVALGFGCEYMVGASPPAVARRFQKVFRDLGYPTRILENIAVPLGEENQHMELQFIIVGLRHQSLNWEY